MRFQTTGKTVCGALLIAVFASASVVSAGQVVPPDLLDGYLDNFNLADGREIDIGELGGGILGDPSATKITVVRQESSAGPWPPEVLPSDGRLTGVVHGKFLLDNLGDRTFDGFVNGDDVADAFDVAWQVVGFNKSKGPGTAFFKANQAVGPELTVGFHPLSANFPPTPGGTSSIFNMAACSSEGASDVNPALGPRENCFEFAAGLDVANLPGGVYDGWIDYTFAISIPGVSDSNPGLTESEDTSWIITALLSPLPFGTPVQFGTGAYYDPNAAVTESEDDLFNPQLFALPGQFAFPPDDATQSNVPFAVMLTSVQIDVIPEPGTLALVGLGLLTVIRRRR